MDISKNSDYFFVVESFKTFFEKMLNIINDPKGRIATEWLKFKEVLISKDCSASSVYLYVSTLVLSPEEENFEPNKIIKLKK